MKIIDWLTSSMHKLTEAGVDSPRRDCLVLVEDLLKKDRSWVIAHPEYKLNKRQIGSLNKLVAKRAKREPLAFIRGKAWFYKRFFAVNPNVMIPRPESETFIELLKKLKPESIIDVGTGSGCLAITAKLELSKAEVIATDISLRALPVAKRNAKNHKADIKFVHGSLLEPVYKLTSKSNLPAGGPSPKPRVLMANLPYVPDGLVTSPEINHEPESALFSGRDGLDHYKRFWVQVKNYPLSARYILTESLASQHEDMVKLAQKAGWKVSKTKDLIQVFTAA
jgi:release factor glutamine methyltransferase